MVSLQPEFASFQFSTRQLDPDCRVAVWNSEFGRTKARRMLAPRSANGRPFHLDMKGCCLGGREPAGHSVEVMRVAVTAGGTAHRGRDLVADGNDDVVLHFQQRGMRITSQRGREHTVPPGGGVFTTNAEPSTIVLPGPARFVCLAIPRRAMLDLAPGMEDALARPVAPDSGALRLLVHYVGILDEASLADSALRQAITTHLHDLCALAIGPAGDAVELIRGRGLQAARLRTIKADITRHLADPLLSAETVACREGISTRYVHKLFEREGTTFSRFILRLRLQHVYRLLRDGWQAHTGLPKLPLRPASLMFPPSTVSSAAATERRHPTFGRGVCLEGRGRQVSRRCARPAAWARGSTGLAVRILSGSLTASLVTVGFPRAITRKIATVLAGRRSFWRSPTPGLFLAVLYSSMLGGRQRVLQRAHSVLQKGAGLAAYVPNGHREADPCQQGREQPATNERCAPSGSCPSASIAPIARFIGVLCRLDERKRDRWRIGASADFKVTPWRGTRPAPSAPNQRFLRVLPARTEAGPPDRRNERNPPVKARAATRYQGCMYGPCNLWMIQLEPVKEAPISNS
jgi:AraC-like DNA-binding protein